jgi:hypothetical protein
MDDSYDTTRDANGDRHPDAALLADIAALERRAGTDAYFARRGGRTAVVDSVAASAPATWAGLRAKGGFVLAAWQQAREDLEKYRWPSAAPEAALEEALAVLRILDEDGADMGYAFAVAQSAIQARRSSAAERDTVGDLPLTPDAALIAACDEFANISRQRTALMNDEGLSEDARDDAEVPLMDRLEALLDSICEMRAVTVEGLRARGRMMVAYQVGSPVFPGGPWPDAMVAALLHDLTEGHEPPADRELLALAGELAERVKVEEAAWDAAKGELPEGPRVAAADAELERTGLLIDRMAKTRAVGLPGLLAKFRAIMWCSDNVPVTEGSGTTQERLIASLCADLGAMEAA